MYDLQHDATININNACARIEARSPATREWIETHVTLEQVQTWTGDVLEVAPHHISGLIAGMLIDELKLTIVDGQALNDHANLN
jgi:hypothetical protein